MNLVEACSAEEDPFAVGFMQSTARSFLSPVNFCGCQHIQTLHNEYALAACSGAE